MKDQPVKSKSNDKVTAKRRPRNSYLRRGILGKLNRRVRNKES